MPIRPDLMALYPGGGIRSPEWLELRRQNFERTGWTCEACGAEAGTFHVVSDVLIQLGLAHVDHNPANNAPENLRVWCRGCHLRHDAPHHHASRRTAGGRQLDLFPETLP